MTDKGLYTTDGDFSHSKGTICGILIKARIMFNAPIFPMQTIHIYAEARYIDEFGGDHAKTNLDTNNFHVTYINKDRY